MQNQSKEGMTAQPPPPLLQHPIKEEDCRERRHTGGGAAAVLAPVVCPPTPTGGPPPLPVLSPESDVVVMAPESPAAVQGAVLSEENRIDVTEALTSLEPVKEDLECQPLPQANPRIEVSFTPPTQHPPVQDCK